MLQLGPEAQQQDWGLNDDHSVDKDDGQDHSQQDGGNMHIMIRLLLFQLHSFNLFIQIYICIFGNTLDENTFCRMHLT